MKKLLIISPYFPPSNAADMQRVRMSLPYFTEFGWDAEVVCVDEKYSEMVKDDLLLQSVPQDQPIHKVSALSKKWTSKIGLGSLALRSMWFYLKGVNKLLKQNKYDLIYFSTTQFPICILGSYWKSKFKIPYVIDMQDPWHSDYYQDKPKSHRPPKYWFSYRLNKYLEPIAMKNLDGLISVSASYIAKLKARYPNIKDTPSSIITFGAFTTDMEVAMNHKNNFKSLLQPGFINIVYVGRGGTDMQNAITPVFKALNNGLTDEPEYFKKIKFYFIGTSYAPNGQGNPTIMPLAKKYNVDQHVVEVTDRISYFHALVTLQKADALFIPGSNDPGYTASKLYPYLLTGKPILAIFHEKSNAVEAIKTTSRNVQLLTFPALEGVMEEKIYHQLSSWAHNSFINTQTNEDFDRYSARALTQKQTELFNQSIRNFEGTN